MKKLATIREELKLAGAPSWLFYTREISQLPNLLHKEEEIEAYLYGITRGGFALMLATTERILLVDKRLLSLIVDDEPYSMLSAVRHQVGPLWGKVIVFTRTASFEFTVLNQKSVTSFVTFLEDMMHQQTRSV